MLRWLLVISVVLVVAGVVKCSVELTRPQASETDSSQTEETG